MSRFYSVRCFSASLVVLALAGCGSGVSVRYQPAQMAYEQHPMVALPAAASTFSVVGADTLGIPANQITIGGLHQVPNGGDLHLSLTGAAPTMGPPKYGQFTSMLVTVANGADAPPAYEIVAHWATVTAQQPASLSVAAGGETKTYDVGATETVDVGPKPRTVSGMVQMSTSEYTLMEKEPCSNPANTVRRVRWIADHFAVDVRTVAGAPMMAVSNGRQRVDAEVHRATASLATDIAPTLRAEILARINAILESTYASGQRSLSVSVSAVEGDGRFTQAIQALGGTAGDRYASAAATFQSAQDDASARSAVRAVAAYDLAICRLGMGDAVGAKKALGHARDFNAKAEYGMFESTGTNLTNAIDRLDATLQEWIARGNTPESGVSSAVAAQSAAASTTVPAEMTDDVFMAAYPALMQDAVAKKDTATLQALGARMASIIQKRSVTPR